MNRYMINNLFGIEGYNIAWYGVIIGMGMVLGVLLASYRARKNGYKVDLIVDLSILAIPLAILCARTYYVVFGWQEYAQNPISVFAIHEGGLAIYGGVIGGLLATILFCNWKKVPLLMLVDLAVPSLVLGQAIGRWGNFMNQEAYGAVITNSKLQFFPYGVYIDAVKEWHQATFFYESAWNIIVFVLLLFIARKTRKDGTLLAVYFIGYGLGRFLIEGLRTDSLYLVGNIRVSQILSLILIFTGVILIVLIKNNKIRNKEYHGNYLR